MSELDDLFDDPEDDEEEEEEDDLDPFVLIEPDEDTHYFGLIFSPQAGDPAMRAFAECGESGGGYSWERVAARLVKKFRLRGIRLDSEAGMFSARCSKREPLVDLGARLAKLHRVPSRLAKFLRED